MFLQNFFNMYLENKGLEYFLHLTWKAYLQKLECSVYQSTHLEASQTSASDGSNT